MSKEENNPLNIIEEANTKTLEYFNKTYMSNLELVQSLKTELFELEVQIDTLENTRELYTYQVDDRKNVFSPLSTMSDSSNTKGYQLALQIKDLEDFIQTYNENKLAAPINNAFLFREKELATGMEYVLQMMESAQMNECYMRLEDGKYVGTLY